MLSVDYLTESEKSRVFSALEFSSAAHKGQIRKSGEDYISHPIAVAEILTSWKLDSKALCAALLHDVVEDTHINVENISSEFGENIAKIVDGLSKLDKIKFDTKSQEQSENFRKMFLAMSRDVRVILIKLADRLHNMRTLDALSQSKQQEIATETIEIYAPIAYRLGLNQIYHELGELSFRSLYPNRYHVLSKAVVSARGNRKEIIDKIKKSIIECLHQNQIKSTVTGREKSLYSIYKKMLEKKLSFEEVFDIYGFRITVSDLSDCYLALGIIHQNFKPLPGKFKDYIAIPKNNGYQSLHTTVFTNYSLPIEIQIRTNNMHKIAESGLASHWLYKDNDANLSQLQLKTHEWMKNVIETHSNANNADEYLENLKVDLFPDEVFVFTPKGRIINLPKNSTCIDFAYAIHSDIGNNTIAAEVNGHITPLRYSLRNGDQINIIQSEHARPNTNWLNFVVTHKARNNIISYLKTMQLEESITFGKKMLAQALTDFGIDLKKSKEFISSIEKLDDSDQTFSNIGLGKQLAAVVAKQFIDKNKKINKNSKRTTLLIHGSEGRALQFAKCCKPIPGDPIIGYLKKGYGLTIHTHNCTVAKKYRQSKEKWIYVDWDTNTNKLFEVDIKISVANKTGVLAKVTSMLSNQGIGIENASAETGDSNVYGVIYLTLLVKNRIDLAQIMKKLRQIEEVYRVNRQP